MIAFIRLWIGSFALATLVSAAPASSGAVSASALPSVVSIAASTASVAAPSQTVAFASDNPNPLLWAPGDSPTDPQAIRGSLGASIIGPTNPDVVIQNADLVAPPTTDQGSVKNAKWPFSLSHNRLQTGGWARQENTDVMPIATAMASVNMRLEAGAIRELHWHLTAEWAYVLQGTVQITAINSDGQNFLSEVNAGDLWYFPPGIPHSLQATNTSSAGAEFLLVFNDGAFSEDSTFLLTDWLAHVPKEVLAANFKTNISAFDHIPGSQLYIFPSSPPPVNAQAVVSPQGTVPEPFSFALSQVTPTKLSGGTVKVVDSSTFKVSTAIAAAEVTVEPGAIRELHWHPTQDEWSYFVEGQGRVTLFAAQGNARTFNYQAGDIGYVPAGFGHYVQNVGNSTLKYLEIFNSDRFQDISLNQWLALTPPDLVKAHLQLSDEVIDSLSKTKPTVVGPA